MGTTGLRERHAARTRGAIVAAALQLFDEKGFQATTVDEIAARAEIAPRTFFRYFPAKEAVLFARSGDQRERVATELAARPDSEHPFVSLVSVIGGIGEDFEGQRREIKLLQKIAAQNPGVWAYERTLLEADMVQTLAGFVADRLGVSIETDPRPQVWAALAMSTFRIALHLWLDTGQKGRLRPVIERALVAAAEATEAMGDTGRP
jgi:AcrR family transcriptional regulator